MTRHVLKYPVRWFAQLLDGSATYVLRRADRDFAVGDRLCLQEYDTVHSRYTAREVEVTVTSVVTAERSGGALQTGRVLLGVRCD